MAKTRYVPPVQGKFGMIADSLFLLLLVYGALLTPLLIDFSSDDGAEVATEATTEAATWESLGQNPVMQDQWEKLGVSLEEAETIINDKFDYTIRPLPLIAIAIIIIGYFFFLLRVSDREYRQVINEKFDD